MNVTSELVCQYGYSADSLRALGTPITPKTTFPRAECGQRRGITPCQIRRADRVSACLVELLCKPAVGGSVPCDNFDESVRMRADRIRASRVRTRVRVVRARGDVRRELLEERFGRERHRDCAEDVPCEKRIVQLLSDGESRDVPRLFVQKKSKRESSYIPSAGAC